MRKIYVIPYVTNGRGIVLEYRFDNRKIDRRTRFSKENEKYLVSFEKLLLAISKFNAIVKDNRIIMRSGNDSYEFQKFIGYNDFKGF